MDRFFMFLTGVFLISFSLAFWILYMNLFIFGVGLVGYLKECLVHFECYLVFIGFFLLYMVKKIKKAMKIDY